MINNDNINVLLNIVNSCCDKNHLVLHLDKFGPVIKLTRDEFNHITSRLARKKDTFSIYYEDRAQIVNFRDMYAYGLKFIISGRNKSITFSLSSRFIRDFGENHYIHIIKRFFDEVEFEIDESDLHQRLEVGHIEITLDCFGLSVHNKIKNIRSKIISNYLKARPIERRTIKINRKYDDKHNYIVSNENDKDTFVKAFFNSERMSHIKIYDKLSDAFYTSSSKNEHWIRYFSRVLYDLGDDESIKFSEMYLNLSAEERTIIFNRMFETQAITRLEYSLNHQMISKFIGYDENPLSPNFLLFEFTLTNKQLLLKYLIENIWNVTYKDRNKFKLLPLFKNALNFIDNYRQVQDNGIIQTKEAVLMKNILGSVEHAYRMHGGVKSLIYNAKLYVSEDGDTSELIKILSDTSDLLITGLNDIYAIKAERHYQIAEMASRKAPSAPQNGTHH